MNNSEVAYSNLLDTEKLPSLHCELSLSQKKSLIREKSLSKAAFDQKLLEGKEGLEESFYPKIFKRFAKTPSIDRFRIFFNWIESKKLVNEKQFYSKLKNFHFNPSSPIGQLSLKHEVTCLCLTPDDGTLISGSQSGSIFLWDTKTQQLKSELKGHSNKITCLLSDEIDIYSGSSDQSIRIWHDGVQIKIFHGHTARVMTMALSLETNNLISGGEDGLIIVWNMINPKNIQKLIGHKGPVSGVILLRNTTKIISSGWDNTIRTWNLEEGTLLHTINEAHKEAINCICLSKDGTFFASAGQDKVVKIWNTETLKSENAIESSAPIKTLDISPDNGLLVAGSSDKTIKVWNLRKNNELKSVLEGHSKEVSALCVASNGKRIYSGSLDRSIKTWRFHQDREKHLLKGHRARINAMIVTLDDERLISAGEEGEIYVWDLQNAVQITRIKAHSSQILGLAITPQGNKLASMGEDNTVKIWNLANYENLGTLKSHKGAVTCGKFASNEFLITGTENQSLILWNVDSMEAEFSHDEHPGKINILEVVPKDRIFTVAEKDVLEWSFQKGFSIVRKYQSQNDEITAMKVAPVTGKLISASLDGKITIFDTNTGEVIKTLQGDFPSVTTMDVSEANSSFITGDSFGNLRIWNLRSDSLRGINDLMKSPVKCVKFSTSGNKIFLSGTQDTNISLVDISKVKCIKIIREGINSEVKCLAIKNVFTIYVTGDKTVNVFDNRTKQIVKQIPHSHNISAIAFSEKSHILVTGGSDNIARIWNLFDFSLIKELKVCSNEINNLFLFERGRKLAIASEDCYVYAVDLDNGQKILGYVHRGPLRCVVQVKEKLISGCREGSLKVFNWKTNNELKVIYDLPAILTLEVSKKLNFIIVGNSDAKIRVYDLKSYMFVHLFEGHKESICSLSIPKIGSHLFSGSADTTIRIWDLKSFKYIAALEGHKNSVTCLDFHSKKLVSGSLDKSMRVWNLEELEKIPFLEGHYQKVMCAIVNPDGTKVFTGSFDKQILVWDVQKRKQIAVMRGHGWDIRAMTISHEGDLLISCSYTTQVCIWELHSYTRIYSFRNITPSDSMILSHDGLQLIFGCCDTYVRVWHMHKKEHLRHFEGHLGLIFALALTKDDSKLLTGSKDSKIIIWDFQSTKQIQVLKGHSSEVKALVLTKDDKKLFSAGEDAKIIVWNMDSYEILNSLEGPMNFPKRLLLNADESKLFVACYDNETRKIPGGYLGYWDLINEQYHKSAATSNIYAICLSSDEKTIVTGHTNRSVIFWDASNLEEPSKVYEGYSSTITAEFTNANCSLVILGDSDNKISVFEFKTWRRVTVLQGHSKQINSLICNDEGTVLVSAGQDKSIRLWSLPDKNERKAFHDHGASVNALVFLSPKQDLFASGSDDKSIKIWSITEETLVRSIDAKNDEILSLLAFKDSQRFLSGGSEKLLKVWNVHGNTKPKTLFACDEKLINLAVSPDERILICLLPNLKMQAWDMEELVLLSEMPIKENFYTLPKFLSHKYNRLILYFENIYDCLTGELLFSVEINESLKGFFLNTTTLELFFLNSSLDLIKFNQIWFSTYLNNFLMNDSLLTMQKNEEKICSKTQSHFPFLLSFFHLNAIFDQMGNFTLEKVQEAYKTSSFSLSAVCSSDILRNTPLDILILKRNTTMLMKYFEIIFYLLQRNDCRFYEKVRFFTYSYFSEKHFLDIFSSIIDICNDDLSIISKIFDSSFLELDSTIYDKSLMFEELDEPILIETDSVYGNNSKFLKKELFKYFNKDKKKINDEEKASLVKCKIICLPGLTDLNNETTQKIFGNISECDAENDIFGNKILSILVNYLWDNQVKFYYKIDLAVFLTFFILFNFNLIYLAPLLEQTQGNISLKIIGSIIDIFTIFYSVLCCCNELKQMKDSGFTSYFKSIWNYFDISLIPLLFATSSLNLFSLYADSEDGTESINDIKSGTKIVYSLAMFCFWFRFLSFFRSYKETSYMIRLIFNVIVGVKHFVLFMILFMLTLASTLFVLRTDYDELAGFPSFLDVLFAFYSSTVGDSSGISEYSIEFPSLIKVFMILSTFLFPIILLNLLVAIIGDKHGEINDAEEKTRLYELMNIIVDTSTSIMTNFAKKLQRKRNIGKYLLYVYNEKHEQVEENDFQRLERKMEENMKELKEFIVSSLKEKK